jgi:peptidoglycan/xylan/chitin deacetylase (PgdA/CDA1 family)
MRGTWTDPALDYLTHIARIIPLASLVGFSFTVGLPGRQTKSHSTVITHRPKGFTVKLMALTIDDSPDTNITPKVLSALRNHRARATFFVLGSLAKRHPGLLRQMIAEGHEVGSHTYSHAIHPSHDQALRELNDTVKAIEKAIGRRPTLFRPPGGNLKSWTAKLAGEQAYTIVLWTLSSADTATHSPEVIANNIIHTPSPGDIVLMHDSSSKAATAEALPHVLDELGRQGWNFVTVSQMLNAWDEFSKRHQRLRGPK